MVENYYQVGHSADASAEEKAVADLLDQIFSEPCFDTLRTKEQLGYTVTSGVRHTHGVLGFVVGVQSSRHPPGFVDARIEAFLEAFDAVRKRAPSPAARFCALREARRRHPRIAAALTGKQASLTRRARLRPASSPPPSEDRVGALGR